MLTKRQTLGRLRSTPFPPHSLGAQSSGIVLQTEEGKEGVWASLLSNRTQMSVTIPGFFNKTHSLGDGILGVIPRALPFLGL